MKRIIVQTLNCHYKLITRPGFQNCLFFFWEETSFHFRGTSRVPFHYGPLTTSRPPPPTYSFFFQINNPQIWINLMS